MSGYDQLIKDVYSDSDRLDNVTHSLYTAIYKYVTGELSPEAYNAKIEETIQYLQSIKFTP